MARHTTVRQRPPAADEDTFVSGVLEATDWTRRHGTLILGAAAAVVILLIGIFYYRSYRSALEDRATSELTQVRQIAASGNLPLATRQLKQFVAKYSNTRAGSEGRVLLGQMLLQEGQGKEAVGVLQPLASDLKDPLGPGAAFLLGAAYESQQNAKQAEATYLRLADNARFEFQRRDALEDAARLKLQNNDPAGAASLYERILKAVPDTAVGRPIYEMRLAEAQAAAQAKR